MKKRIMTITAAMISASMLFGMTAAASSEAEKDSGFSLNSVLDLAKEVWDEIPETDQDSLLSSVGELFGSDTLQSLMTDVMDQIPEESQEMVFEMVGGLIGGFMGGDLGSDDLSAWDGMPSYESEESTAEDILDQTGIEMPENMQEYSMQYHEDGTKAGVGVNITDTELVILTAIPGMSDLTSAMGYVYKLDSENVTETMYHEAKALFDGEKGYFAWLDEETQNFFCIYMISMEDSLIPEEAAYVEMADTLLAAE